MIANEGSTQCTDVITRMDQLLRLAKDVEEPCVNLRACGLAFDTTLFYIHKKILSCVLLIPESLLCRRLDQAGLVAVKDAASSQHVAQFLGNFRGWEARSYSTRTDCEKMRAFVVKWGLGVSGKKTKTSLDETFSPNLEFNLDQITRLRLPERV